MKKRGIFRELPPLFFMMLTYGILSLLAGATLTRFRFFSPPYHRGAVLSIKHDRGPIYASIPADKEGEGVLRKKFSTLEEAETFLRQARSPYTRRITIFALLVGLLLVGLSFLCSSLLWLRLGLLFATAFIAWQAYLEMGFFFDSYEFSPMRFVAFGVAIVVVYAWIALISIITYLSMVLRWRLKNLFSFFLMIITQLSLFYLAAYTVNRTFFIPHRRHVEVAIKGSSVTYRQIPSDKEVHHSDFLRKSFSSREESDRFVRRAWAPYKWRKTVFVLLASLLLFGLSLLCSSILWLRLGLQFGAVLIMYLVLLKGAALFLVVPTLLASVFTYFSVLSRRLKR